MAHLTHKLPWSKLAKAMQTEPYWTYNAPQNQIEIDPRATEFLDALSNAITEFAATDTRKDEKEPYDVDEWETGHLRDHAVFGLPACMFEAFVPTILNGYVVLNLLVEDEERLRSVVFRPNRSWLWENDGRGDGGHPEWLANKLKPILQEDQPNYRCAPKPLSPEVVAQIREYCGELFKCMYTRPDLFTRENLEKYLWLERHMQGNSISKYSSCCMVY